MDLAISLIEPSEIHELLIYLTIQLRGNTVPFIQRHQFPYPGN